jgi:site-specific recombinase XerD
LISLKRYLGWATQQQIIHYDPSAPVKLVGQVDGAPRHLDDKEEQALVAAVTEEGNLRDRVLIILLSHTVFLFPSEKTKGALSERMLGYIVKKYAAVAKLADVSPHDLRHRFGYRMAESVPLHQLAQIMGHDSLDTTRLYIQGTRHDLQQAVETIAWT